MHISELAQFYIERTHMPSVITSWIMACQTLLWDMISQNNQQCLLFSQLYCAAKHNCQVLSRRFNLKKVFPFLSEWIPTLMYCSAVSKVVGVDGGCRKGKTLTLVIMIWYCTKIFNMLSENKLKSVSHFVLFRILCNLPNTLSQTIF